MRFLVVFQLLLLCCESPSQKRDTSLFTCLHANQTLSPSFRTDSNSPSLPFGGELNSSVFVLERGTGAIWIKWKNPCSTPKCWIWVTFDYIVLWVSISLNSLVRGRKKACHRKASILINKQSLSFSQSSFLILFFASTAEWKRGKWWKETEGRGRGDEGN